MTLLPPAETPAAPRLPRILIVEDDEILADELRIALTDYGMAAEVATRWEAALAALRAAPPDVLLLDQRLGSQDTLTQIPLLRALGARRVIVLTGNRQEVDRIVALEIGADDFLLKPISTREMVARLRAHLRSIDHPAAPAPPAGPAGPSGGWRFSAAARRLARPDGSAVPLTAAEFDLLAYLVARAGTPVDRDRLSQEVLRRPWQAGDRALDNLVLHLRQKLGPGGEHSIATVRNAGYAFTGFPGD
jgi:two-component system OmpR family response regulator